VRRPGAVDSFKAAATGREEESGAAEKKGVDFPAPHRIILVFGMFNNCIHIVVDNGIHYI
jgi:hypothetical protein